MKKIKTLLCVMLVLATAACLCVSVAAEGKYSSWEEWADEECPANPVEGGKHDVFDYSVDATCSHKGTVYKKCKYCHWMYQVGTKETLPHKLTIETGKRKEPTCTEAGWKELQCEVCGALRKETIPTSQAEHKWGQWSYIRGQEPTCSSAGMMIRTCEVCKTTEKKAGEKLEHKWEDVDCVTQKCSKCWQTQVKEGASHGELEYKPLGPNSKDGTHIGICKVCGREVEREAHTYVDDHDCTTDDVCSKCGVTVVKGCASHTKGRSYETTETQHRLVCAVAGCNVVLSEYVDHLDSNKDGKCDSCGVSVPVETKPAETTAPVETTTSDDVTEPAEPTAPAESTTPAESTDPAETTGPAVSTEPAEPETTPTAPETTVPETTVPETTTAEPETKPAEPETTTSAATETPATDAVTPAATETPATETVAPSTTETPTTEAVTSQETHVGTVAPEPAKEGEVIVELGEETDAAISVDNITKTNLTVKNIVEEKFTEYAAYDINLVKDGAKVQPDGTVKVSIALPEGWSDVDVYHVDKDVMTKLESTVKDGYAVFNTTHFSVYVLVNNKSAATPTDTDTTAEPETTGDIVPADDIVPAPEASDETTGAFDGYEPDEDVLLIAPAPKTGDVADATLAVTVTLAVSLACGLALISFGKKRH